MLDAADRDAPPDTADLADIRAATVCGLLHQVIDPEIGVNIVDLGLVYGVRVTDDIAYVRMSLTTPGCPLSGYMDDSIRRVLTGVAGLRAAEVEIVWDPAWNTDMMSDRAKRQLGWIR